MQQKRKEVNLSGSRLARGLKPTALTVYIIRKKKLPG